MILRKRDPGRRTSVPHARALRRRAAVDRRLRAAVPQPATCESKLLFVVWTVIGLVIYFLYGYRHSHVGRGIVEVPELAADAPGSIGVAPMPGAPVPPQDRD